MRPSRIGALTAALAIAAMAGASVAADDSAAPRVYTNADLEALFGPPPPAPPAAAAPRDGADEWGFVSAHLEREYAKLEADRSHDLERRAVEIIDPEHHRRRTFWAWPYAGYPYRGYGVDADRRHGHGKHRGIDRQSRMGVGSTIRPLHARPTMSQIQRAQAMRRAGSDAFPR